MKNKKTIILIIAMAILLAVGVFVAVRNHRARIHSKHTVVALSEESLKNVSVSGPDGKLYPVSTDGRPGTVTVWIE